MDVNSSKICLLPILVLVLTGALTNISLLRALVLVNKTRCNAISSIAVVGCGM